MRRSIALLIVAVILMPSSVFAQQQTQAQTPAVDASKMGVDLSRIKRELAQAQSEEASSDEGLRLAYTVEVVGTAPRINFLEGFRVDGPVPYGPPTHQEVLDVLTPKEFRSPVVPFYSLAVMAVQKLHEYNKKRQCEAEIEEYRRLVMSGVSVAAPRCKQ